ncbi:MAG: type IV pilus modification PilV family protein [Rubripirellula sp.]
MQRGRLSIRMVPAGFTLVEVLLSISLMTIALTGVNLLITNGLRSSVDRSDRTLALCVAQTSLENLLADPNHGFQQGREYPCHEPYQDWIFRWEISPADDDDLVCLCVSVKRTGGGRPSRVSIQWSQLVGRDDLVSLPPTLAKGRR